MNNNRVPINSTFTVFVQQFVDAHLSAHILPRYVRGVESISITGASTISRFVRGSAGPFLVAGLINFNDFNEFKRFALICFLRAFLLFFLPRRLLPARFYKCLSVGRCRDRLAARETRLAVRFSHTTFRLWKHVRQMKTSDRKHSRGCSESGPS